MSDTTHEAWQESRVVFSMPRTPEGWGGAAALWVTVAGWAAAAQARFGASVVVTPRGILSVEQSLAASALAASPRPGSARVKSTVLAPLRTLTSDVGKLTSGLAYKRKIAEFAADRAAQTQFVWSHHELFHDAPVTLAKDLGVPLVAYVHAPVVWEARRWGVRRPGWGTMLERLVEAPSLRKADLVACASDDVADAVVRLGVPREKTLLSSMAVDADRFRPDVDARSVRNSLGIDDEFVVGWVGSFRRFHGVELAVDALSQVRLSVPNAVLLLVGEGFERAAIEAHAARLGLSNVVRFSGQVPNDELPRFVGAFDAAVVTAREGQAFHYSPLKLREYMAAGRPIVAPDIGEIGRTIDDGREALLYPPGDVDILARRLIEIASDRQLAVALGDNARSFAVATSTWRSRLDQVCTALGIGSP